MKILNGKFVVKTDKNENVSIYSKDGGVLSTQSVEAILLLEIVSLLQNINQFNMKQFNERTLYE